VCLDREGRPVVAWREEAKGNGEIYLKRWTGKEWSEIGGSATGGGISRTRGNSREPSLALDPEDRPMVAWFDDTEGNYEVYVRRWTGTAWEGLGGSAEGGGVSLSRGGSVHPSLAVGSDGFPVVVWYEILAGAKREIYAQRWNGALWTDLGGSAAGGGLSRTPGESMAPALVLDSANRPAVVWSDDTSGNFEVYFKRWDGRSWAELGGSATGGGVSRTPGHSSSTFAGLALDAQDRPVIAWDEGQGVTRQIFLRRWSGSAWEDLGGSGEGTGISGSRGICHHASLALDSAGHPTVSWQEGPTEIRFARWTGSGWVDRGVVGQSGNPSAKVYPFLRMDREDRPIVAWESWVSSNVEIHLRRRESLPPAAR
jgi:hypothetical protein